MKSSIFLLVILGFAFHASATPINTSSEVLSSVSIPEQTRFDFGQFEIGVLGGVVNFDTEGVISYIPDIEFLEGSPGGVARLVNAGSSVIATVTITVVVPETTPTSGIGNMAVVGDCQTRGAKSTDDGNCTFSSNKFVGDKPDIATRFREYDSQNIGF